MKDRIVRRSEMVPCKSAFIDTYTPGSHLKENFSIIGPGVTENPEQVINISEPHGFNFGAAGQPPRIKTRCTVILLLKFSLSMKELLKFTGGLMGKIKRLSVRGM